MADAKRLFNATISYHIDLDISNSEYPTEHFEGPYACVRMHCLNSGGVIISNSLALSHPVPGCFDGLPAADKPRYKPIAPETAPPGKPAEVIATPPPTH